MQIVLKNFAPRELERYLIKVSFPLISYGFGQNYWIWLCLTISVNQSSTENFSPESGFWIFEKSPKMIRKIRWVGILFDWHKSNYLGSHFSDCVHQNIIHCQSSVSLFVHLNNTRGPQQFQNSEVIQLCFGVKIKGQKLILNIMLYF